MAGGRVVAPGAGGGEALAFPERPPARVGVQDGQVEAGSLSVEGEHFDTGKEGLAVARALRPRAKQHQAEVGVLGAGEAVGDFGDAGKAQGVFPGAPLPQPLPTRGRGGAWAGGVGTGGGSLGPPSPLWGGLGWGASGMGHEA